eukprot:scaffold7329_cov222-Pinguiococcus_pyrenoidosus.AAC.3
MDSSSSSSSSTSSDGNSNRYIDQNRLKAGPIAIVQNAGANRQAFYSGRFATPHRHANVAGQVDAMALMNVAMYMKERRP